VRTMIELREKCLHARRLSQVLILRVVVSCPYALEEEQREHHYPQRSVLTIYAGTFWYKPRDAGSRVGLLEIYNNAVRQVSNQPGPPEGLQGKLHAGCFA
jgi:hypothetical protein